MSPTDDIEGVVREVEAMAGDLPHGDAWENWRKMTYIAAQMLANARIERDVARDAVAELQKRIDAVKVLESQVREARIERDAYRRMSRDLQRELYQLHNQGSQVLAELTP